MRPSRGMGIIEKSKMPRGKVKERRDNTDFTQYAEGGKVFVAQPKKIAKKTAGFR